MPVENMALFGKNAEAFNSRADELLLCGPAGTGKTIANLAKLYAFCDKYHGCRVLFCRKTRSSMTESGLVTWERDILGSNHPVLTKRPNLRKVRQEYTFDNGSTVVVRGMDNPESVLSSDYDLIYVLEATDLELNDWESLTGRLRTGIAPYQQIIGDCNPTHPGHWLYRRAHQKTEDGEDKLKMIFSSHKDNPRFYDRIAEKWTEEGNRYVNKRLRNMTGARKKRFYEGVWASAEGLVYDGYQPALHNKPSGYRPPDHWPRVWSIDWGFTAPLVLQMWAIDPDGRMILYREIYRTGMRVETLAKQCKQLVADCEERRPVAIVTDHDPEAQETFVHHSGLSCENAWKEDKYEGIEITQGRFDVAEDGLPRMFLVPDALSHAPDDELGDAGRPQSTMEELASYVWDKSNLDKLKEEPLKVNDHGMDAMRYAAIFCERFSGVGDSGWSTGSRDRSIHGDLRKRTW